MLWVFKALLALSTFVGSLITVNFKVSFQGSCLIKTLGTFSAFKRFFSTVNPQMNR